MELEDEQYDLLTKFVEAHLSTPRESRGSFIMSFPHNDSEATFLHSRVQNLRFQGSLNDAEVLAHEGHLLKSSCSSRAVTFAVLPKGIHACRDRRSLDSPSHPTSSRSKGDLDVFIAHASEDNATIVRPLHRALAAEGWKVWLNEAVLEPGDSLCQKIDEGLSKCRYGVVVLSPSLFQKTWPQKELDGLVARETASGTKTILPVWHKINQSGVARYSPTLADRHAGLSEDGLDSVVKKIETILKKGSGK